MQVQWPTPLNHPLMIKQKVTGKGLEVKNIRMTCNYNNQRLGSVGDNDRGSKHFCSNTVLYISFT